AQQQAVQEAKVVYQFELVRQRPNDYVTILLWLSWCLESINANSILHGLSVPWHQSRSEKRLNTW
ncbi:hypothetical protein TW84_04175, partial [Vibrio neptunius]